MRRSLITCTAFITMALLCTASCAQTKGRMISFGPGGKYAGYFVCPGGGGPYPGMVVIHEWWGLTDWMKSQAGKVAQAGYACLAVDLFGKTTTNMQEAQKMVQSLNQKEATAEMLAAADFLRSRPSVPDDRVGSIGWCFGGGQSLNLALNDPKLAAAVIYYGQPVTDVQALRKIRARVLAIYGEVDQSIPRTRVREFNRALAQAGVNHDIYTYPGAGHAFANPSSANYKPKATADAWKKTLDFLNATLKQRK